ncbi:ATP-dependent nuclease subunit B [Weissella viridescens]|uniref:ATP-dependent nuclease subunit B n=1 Tax=Weissella viridescens TaxID=1629 RepID=A0A380P6P0_WEIVI|nr:ATP-dependent nuclease subunit B [Weissella viridescens]
MIVDYKSSKRDFNFTKALSGLELQLMTYWEALSDAEAIEVGGATYFNAQTPLLKLDKEPLLPDYPSLLAYADEKAQQGDSTQGSCARMTHYYQLWTHQKVIRSCMALNIRSRGMR